MVDGSFAGIWRHRNPPVTPVTHGWLPPAYGRRMSSANRTTIGVWVLAAALAGFALVRLIGASGGADPPPIRLDRGGAQASGTQPGPARVGGGGSSGGRRVYVHVAGAVRRPGLVRVMPGSRVAEAIERAGGLGRRADLAGVNLAARVADGQQILVPARGIAAPGSAGGHAGAGAAARPSLAMASVEQLEELDGIGPTLASRIVEYRDSHGGFASLEELGEVEGIGEKRLASLKEALGP